MSHIVTHEELYILDEILPHLILNGAFNIADAHMNHVLANRYRNANGGTDSQAMFSAISEYKRNNVYSHITGFLLKNVFVEQTEDGELILTRKGEYLCAHGKLEIYNLEVEKKFKKDIIISTVQQLISSIQPYGEFIIEPPQAAKPTSVFFAPVGASNESMKAFLDDIKNQRIQYMASLKEEHNRLILDEAAAQYLVDEGYAINRHDIKVDGKIYRQLTDKGRELKECGSIDAFNLSVAENNHRKLRQDRRVDYLYWINFWIMIGAVATLIYTAFQLFDYYENHDLSVMLLEYFCTGAAIGLLSGVVLTILLKSTNKPKKNGS